MENEYSYFIFHLQWKMENGNNGMYTDPLSARDVFLRTNRAIAMMFTRLSVCPSGTCVLRAL